MERISDAVMLIESKHWRQYLRSDKRTSERPHFVLLGGFGESCLSNKRDDENNRPAQFQYQRRDVPLHRAGG
jgi:hypothetical protein